MRAVNSIRSACGHHSPAVCTEPTAVKRAILSNTMGLDYDVMCAGTGCETPRVPPTHAMPLARVSPSAPISRQARAREAPTVARGGSRGADAARATGCDT